MNLVQFFMTFLGAFLFPFTLLTLSDYFIKKWAVLGGLLHTSVVVGSFWLINHGLGLIYQSGPLWVDMAFAAFFGLMTYSKLQRLSLLKATPNMGAALVGAILANLFIVFLG